MVRVKLIIGSLKLPVCTHKHLFTCMHIYTPSVTVLLCVVLVLLCTIYLRVISACLPLVILCSSKKFFQSKYFNGRVLIVFAFVCYTGESQVTACVACRNIMLELIVSVRGNTYTTVCHCPIQCWLFLLLHVCH